jgi:hypothetical protein
MFLRMTDVVMQIRRPLSGLRYWLTILPIWSV